MMIHLATDAEALADAITGDEYLSQETLFNLITLLDISQHDFEFTFRLAKHFVKELKACSSEFVLEDLTDDDPQD